MVDETLTTVEENNRSDGEWVLMDLTHSGLFGLETADDRFGITFSTVNAYIGEPEPYVTFYPTEAEQYDALTLQGTEVLPYWVYEELSHIEHEGELRPVEDYEERYQLSEMRGIKGTYA